MNARYFFVTILLVTTTIKASFAQSVDASNPNNLLVVLKKEIDNTDSPYSTSDWVKGTVKQADGKIFNNQLLKYNEQVDELYFKRDNDEIFKFLNPITEFTLITGKDENNKPIEKHYRNGYKNAYGNTKKSYYEILCDGKTQLLKKEVKNEYADKGFDNVTTVKKFEIKVSYFLFISGNMVFLNRDKSSILAILGNKRADFTNFIKTNDIDFKSDHDLAKLIAVYNSL